MRISKTLVLIASMIFWGGVCHAKALRVGIEGTCVPFVITKAESQYEGFDVDLIESIAKKAGYDEVTYVNMPFDALLPSVLTEQVDVAISGITITKDRNEIVDFVGPYYDAGLNALMPISQKEKIKDVANLEGRTVCVKQGTTCSDYAGTIKDVKLLGFESEQQSFNAFLDNKCEALISDDPIISYFLHNESKEEHYKLKDKLTFEQFGIMVSKQHPEIYEKISTALKDLMDGDGYSKIYQKWFG